MKETVMLSVNALKKEGHEVIEIKLPLE